MQMYGNERLSDCVAVRGAFGCLCDQLLLLLLLARVITKFRAVNQGLSAWGALCRTLIDSIVNRRPGFVPVITRRKSLGAKVTLAIA